jgi:hypothetical protein
MLRCHFTSDQRAFKRACLDPDDAPDVEYKGLHALFWGKLGSHFRTISTKIPNERTLIIEGVKESMFNIISLPDGFSFPKRYQSMFVPKIYEKFFALLRDLDMKYQDAVDRNDPRAWFGALYSTIITGQPGIGEYFLFISCNRCNMVRCTQERPCF